MNTKALKPFDLEKALAGDPVLHFDVPVHVYKSHYNGNFIIAESHSRVYYVNTNELRMAPKKVTRWVNFYDGNMACHYPTKEAACIHASPDALAVAIPVEYEE